MFDNFTNWLWFKKTLHIQIKEDLDVISVGFNVLVPTIVNRARVHGADLFTIQITNINQNRVKRLKKITRQTESYDVLTIEGALTTVCNLRVCPASGSLFQDDLQSNT
jgi:hypothetical protein